MIIIRKFFALLTLHTVCSPWSCDSVRPSVRRDDKWLLQEFRSKFHFSTQSGTAPLSLLRSAVPVDPTSLNSSAKNDPVFFMSVVRLFMWSKGKSGPNGNPWGRQLLTSRLVEHPSKLLSLCIATWLLGAVPEGLSQSFSVTTVARGGGCGHNPPVYPILFVGRVAVTKHPFGSTFRSSGK